MFIHHKLRTACDTCLVELLENCTRYIPGQATTITGAICFGDSYFMFVHSAFEVRVLDWNTFSFWNVCASVCGPSAKLARAAS